ncbi:MAG: rhodanese-like domain-containing protein [Oscillospiraceae bacterium]|nr:rhodanese-like domain-containing protein [Oscillospiraceae bacterium]
MSVTNIHIISPQEAQKMMSETNPHILLDVRTPAEYGQVRIEGAKLIPADELGRRASAELPDKNIPVLVYCHSGARASKAVELLTGMGYDNVLSFGGILDWPYDTVSG